MANPDPEISPDLVKSAGIEVYATGRSDYPNQVNNALAFPGIFLGLLEGRIKNLTSAMKISAAKAISELVKKPTADMIVPSVLDRSSAQAVAKAIKLHKRRND